MKIFTLAFLGTCILALSANLSFGQDNKTTKDKTTKEYKTTNDKLDENEQIIIKWKSDMRADSKGEKGDKGEKGSKGSKDVKLVIELKNDDVLVNGKPLKDFDDDELAVLKKNIMVMDGNTFSLAVPGHPVTPFRGGSWTMENDHDQVYAFANPNKAFLGVGSEKTDKGVVITEITTGSAAEKAGLKKGDIITKIDATSITSPGQLSETIGNYKPNAKISVTIKRAGKEQKLTATLGTNPSPMAFNYPNPKMYFDQDFDFKMEDWMEHTPKLGIKAQDTEDGKGVKVLEVDEESAAEKAGLKEGDIITSFDGSQVNSVNQLVDISKAAKDAKKSSLPIKFLRDDKEQSVDLKIPRKLKTADL